MVQPRRLARHLRVRIGYSPKDSEEFFAPVSRYLLTFLGTLVQFLDDRIGFLSRN